MLRREKIFQSELTRNKRKIIEYFSVLTTARLCPCRELCRPMLATLSSWTKKNTNFGKAIEKYGIERALVHRGDSWDDLPPSQAFPAERRVH